MKSEHHPFEYRPEFAYDPNCKRYVMLAPSQQAIAHDLILAFHRDVDGKIRQALIDMGWTPPQAEKRPL